MVQEQRWLFVNKTSKSKRLSRSSGSETSHIFSHAQRGQRSTNDAELMHKVESCKAAYAIKRTRPAQCLSGSKEVVAQSMNAVTRVGVIPLGCPLHEICISSFDAFPTQHYLDLVLSTSTYLQGPRCQSLIRCYSEQIGQTSSSSYWVHAAKCFETN